MCLLCVDCVLTCRNIAPAYCPHSISCTGGASSSSFFVERKYLSRAKQECTTFEPQIEFQENLNQPKNNRTGSCMNTQEYLQCQKLKQSREKTITAKKLKRKDNSFVFLIFRSFNFQLYTYRMNNFVIFVLSFLLS